jgi:hypothetical protein
MVSTLDEGRAGEVTAGRERGENDEEIVSYFY